MISINITLTRPKAGLSPMAINTILEILNENKYLCRRYNEGLIRLWSQTYSPDHNEFIPQCIFMRYSDFRKIYNTLPDSTVL